MFKRHLTSVHGVEQTPPNSRKKTLGHVNIGKSLSGYAPDATGICSTCSVTFRNAQDFYEHLDDCVLRIVEQEISSESVNMALPSNVEVLQAVQESESRLPSERAAIDALLEHKEDETDEDHDHHAPQSVLDPLGLGNRVVNCGYPQSLSRTAALYNPSGGSLGFSLCDVQQNNHASLGLRLPSG